MVTVLRAIALIVCVLVGLVSLLMASKNLRAQKLLPFHEQALGKSWEELDEGSRLVISILMRLTGLGFAMVGLLLIILPIIAVVTGISFLGTTAALISFLYCLGLFVVNYRLYKTTGAKTPWQGAMYASIALVIAAGMFVVY